MSGTTHRAPCKMTAKQFELLSACMKYGMTVPESHSAATIDACARYGWVQTRGSRLAPYIAITDAGKGALLARTKKPKNQNAKRPNRTQTHAEIRRARDCVVTLRTAQPGTSVYASAIEGLERFYEATARLG